MLNSGDPEVLMDPNLDIDFNDDQVQRVVMATTLCIDPSARLRPNVSEVIKSELSIILIVQIDLLCDIRVHICSYVPILLIFKLLSFTRNYKLFLENYGVYLLGSGQKFPISSIC